MKPNFIIVGSARCGTTSLYHYLKQHPEICMSDVKEPKFFSASAKSIPHSGPGDVHYDLNIVSDEKAYYSMFNPRVGEHKVGEASSDYLYYHSSAAAKIFNELGDIPIFIMLRDPADRAWSAYQNMIRDQRETETFEVALENEELRRSKNWDWMWHYKTAGYYSKQVETYKNTFSTVHIIIYEEFTADTQRCLEKVCDVLKVNNKYSFDTTIRYSKSGKVKNPVITVLSNQKFSFISMLRRWLLKIMKRGRIEKIVQNFIIKEEIPAPVRHYLKQCYVADIQALSEITGKKFNLWK